VESGDGAVALDFIEREELLDSEKLPVFFAGGGFKARPQSNP
jgi:hypothetical protein